VNFVEARPQVIVERPSTSAKERFDRIYATLRDRICLIEYAPGHRLAEEDLATEFEVSRTPIRRVLQRLEAEGLVESRHGVGTIVTDATIEELTHVYLLRMELAALMGRLSPKPRTEGDLDRIRELIRRCDELAEKPDAKTFAMINMAFRSELAAMTGNQALRDIDDRLYFQTARIVLKAMPSLKLAEEIAIFRREMVDIVAAAEVADFDSVGCIRRAHISMSFRRMAGYRDERAP
jgi:DNA-binding GntR family transcriptional regulator